MARTAHAIAMRQRILQIMSPSLVFLQLAYVLQIQCRSRQRLLPMQYMVQWLKLCTIRIIRLVRLPVGRQSNLLASLH